MAWRRAPAFYAIPLLQYAPASGDGGQSVLLDILLFFTKAGAFVFGSGLAVVPFLYQGVVQDFHWLTEQQFTDAVAVAMITPGPVVITVAFIGYLVAGLPGASVAAIGILLPVFIPVAVLSPWFKRHRENAQLKAFVQGATAAATGAITGSVVILGQRAIFDVPAVRGKGLPGDLEPAGGRAAVKQELPAFAAFAVGEDVGVGGVHGDGSGEEERVSKQHG